MAAKQKLHQEHLRLVKQLTCLRGELVQRIRSSSEGDSTCDDDIDIEDTEYNSESDRSSMDGSGGSDGCL